MRTRVTISVPDDVYLLIKQQSALHGKSMSAWVEATLVEHHARKKAGKPVLEPDDEANSSKA